MITANHVPVSVDGVHRGPQHRVTNTAADHLAVLDEAISALPPGYRRRLMTADGAGASHALITRLDKLAARHGHSLIYSLGWELGERERKAIAQVPQAAWQIAVGSRGEPRASAAPIPPAATRAAATASAGWRKLTSPS